MFGDLDVIAPTATALVGVVGPKGSSLLGGPRAPTAADGFENDFWLALIPGAVALYGPKAGGVWPSASQSLVGPTGAAGPQILSSNGAPTGSIGHDGDYYFNTAASIFYGPKNSGSWPLPGFSLVGQVGPPGPPNTLSVTVTTLPAGSQVTATITGTPPNQSLALGIPKGDPGRDGTGTGTVVGPSGTNPTKAGQIAVFTDPTGTNIGPRPSGYATLGDNNSTLASGVRTAATSVAFTAPRTVTLPAASAYGPGDMLKIVDAVGAITTTNTLTLAAQGSDTLNGGLAQTFGSTRSQIDLVSDGVSAWTYDVQGIGRGGTGASSLAGAQANLGVAFAYVAGIVF